MGRINKTNKTTPVTDDEILIYDSEDTSDDKNITLGQVSNFVANTISIDAKANIDLSNLSTTGQAVIDNKTNVDLSNLSTTGQAVINAKANVAADNFSAAGKANLVDIVMPSSSYITLTAGASGSTYTAPANGYVVMVGNASAGQVYLASSKLSTTSATATGVAVGAAYLSVLSGDVVTYRYNTTPSLFRFYYAEGSKP